MNHFVSDDMSYTSMYNHENFHMDFHYFKPLGKSVLLSFREAVLSLCAFSFFMIFCYDDVIYHDVNS